MNTHVKLSDILDFSSKEEKIPRLVIAKALSFRDRFNVTLNDGIGRVAYIKPEYADKITYGYLFNFLNSFIAIYLYDKKVDFRKGYYHQVKMKEFKNLPIKLTDWETQQKFETVASYVINNDDSWADINLTRLGLGMLYDVYFHEAFVQSKCEFLKYLEDLPELEGDFKQKQKIITGVIDKYFNIKAPLAISYFRADSVEEVRYMELGYGYSNFDPKECERILGLES